MKKSFMAPKLVAEESIVGLTQVSGGGSTQGSWDWEDFWDNFDWPW
jgi:hypothetical protein